MTAAPVIYRRIPSNTTALPPACTVTGFLNLRTEPSRRGVLIVVLTEGDRVTILRGVGDWMNVQTRDDKAGFIYGKYCQE